MNYRIGLDIGTTATKACAFSEEGKMIGLVERDYALEQDEPGQATQDPEAVLTAAAEALKALIDCTEGQPLSVGLSCPMHSVILLDEDKAPISPVYTWADTRGVAVMDRFSEEQRREFHRQTGTPVHPMAPLVTLLWLREEESELFKRAAYTSDLKSLLVHRWSTAGLVIDEQCASATGMMCLRTDDWLDQIREFLGKDLPELPRIKPANHQLMWREEVAAQCGTEAVELYLGGSDGVLASYATAVTTPGHVAMSIGTSGAVRTRTSSHKVDPDLGLFVYKLTDGDYVLGGPTNNGGKVLEYWQELLGSHFSDIAAFVDAALATAPEECPIFVPWLNGERAPVWDAAASAELKGLRGYHTPAHIARAVLEGVTDNIVCILKNLEAATVPTEKILISGGVTRSAGWVELIGERAGCAIEEARAAQASAYGAALVYRL